MDKLIKDEDVKIILSSVGVFVISIIALYTNLEHVSVAAAWLSIIVVDIYFVYVIFYAGVKSDEHKANGWKWGKWVPYKFSGIIVFGFLYFSAIIAFAKVFMMAGAPGYSKTQPALYKSVTSITSFSYDNYISESCSLQWLQMFQSLNGILLLTATFGFLISRISAFKEEITLKDIHLTLQSMMPTKAQADAMAAVKDIITDNDKFRGEITELKTKITQLEIELKNK